MAGVRISSLTHEFDGREVFRDLGFAYIGPCLAVVGPNGSGKSTLLRILAGLLAPTSGNADLMLGDAPVPKTSLRTVVGLVAPDLKLYAELTARENLRFLLRARRAKAVEAAASAALEEVGLADRADDPIRELSSGLRQRAALAAAIAHDPRVLLLDEPSSNLDESGLDMLRDLVGRRAETGMVVIATNDPKEAAMATECLDLGGRP